jgi:hypothetical protein
MTSEDTTIIIKIDLSEEALETISEGKREYFLETMNEYALSFANAFSKKANIVLFNLRHRNYGE